MAANTESMRTHTAYSRTMVYNKRHMVRVKYMHGIGTRKNIPNINKYNSNKTNLTYLTEKDRLHLSHD